MTGYQIVPSARGLLSQPCVSDKLWNCPSKPFVPEESLDGCATRPHHFFLHLTSVSPSSPTVCLGGILFSVCCSRHSSRCLSHFPSTLQPPSSISYTPDRVASALISPRAALPASIHFSEAFYLTPARGRCGNWSGLYFALRFKPSLYHQEIAFLFTYFGNVFRNYTHFLTSRLCLAGYRVRIYCQ